MKEVGLEFEWDVRGAMAVILTAVHVVGPLCHTAFVPSASFWPWKFSRVPSVKQPNLSVSTVSHLKNYNSDNQQFPAVANTTFSLLGIIFATLRTVRKVIVVKIPD